MREKGSSWEERSEKRDAMRVYWVEGGIRVGVVRAWWGVYSPDWERMSWFVSLEVRIEGLKQWKRDREWISGIGILA